MRDHLRKMVRRRIEPRAPTPEARLRALRRLHDAGIIRVMDLVLVAKGDDGTVIEKEVFKFPDAGVAMAMYNLDDSIRDFARASLNYGIGREWPVYLSTKNTILKAYDGRFKDIFEEVYQAEFKVLYKKVWLDK